MSNAVDAMRERRHAQHPARRESSADRVRIDVTDTGHGIPQALLPRIFEPWVSTKKPGRGTGLGLPIARDVVSAHGGSISVISETGQGTTFTIELPSETGRDRPPTLMSAVATSRILVLDDDPGTCRFMQELLARPDREIEATNDPEQALARARAKPFDLVISDLKLNARLDGIDVLRAVREHSPATPVIIVTGFGELEKAVEAVREGAFDFVSKPFNITELKGLVERALQTRAGAAAGRGDARRDAAGAARPHAGDDRGLQADRARRVSGGAGADHRRERHR